MAAERHVLGVLNTGPYFSNLPNLAHLLETALYCFQLSIESISKSRYKSASVGSPDPNSSCWGTGPLP